MRKAEIDHAWTKCRTPTSGKVFIHELLLPAAAGQTRVDISSRVSAFVGANGAGKTTLLRSIEQLLNQKRAVGMPPRVDAISGRWNGKPFSVPSLNATDRSAPEALLIDASAEAHKLLDFFSAQKDLDDLLHAYGAKRYKPSEAAKFQFLCGRQYDYIEVTEVEGPATDSLSVEPPTFPFFAVEASNVQYDMRSMGFGELCAFYAVWALSRAEKGSIVLLDEPDSHLSPKARKTLPHVIAQIAADRELWVAFTTHSTEALEPLQVSELYLVESSYAPLSLSVSPAGARRRALRLLGISPIRRLLLAVEDVDAEMVAAMVINRFAEDVSGAIDIQRMIKGASQIVPFVHSFPRTSLMGRCVALVDGDKRNDYSGSDSVLFLPGVLDPIAEARAVVTASPGLFARHFGLEERRVVAALQAVQHVDHHDFCASLLGELTLAGTSVADMRRALIHTWLSEDGVTAEAKTLANAIVQMVDRLPFSDWERQAADTEAKVLSTEERETVTLPREVSSSYRPQSSTPERPVCEHSASEQPVHRSRPWLLSWPKPILAVALSGWIAFAAFAAWSTFG